MVDGKVALCPINFLPSELSILLIDLDVDDGFAEK
jgi:hypothetical protein